MEIYLVRYGAAYEKEEDSERHLNSDGVNQYHLKGKALNRLGIQLDLIVSSPKPHARQTAEIIAEEVGYLREEIKVTETLVPTAFTQDTISYLDDFAKVERIMLAGHLPLLRHLASELLVNTPHISFYFEPNAVCYINNRTTSYFLR